MIIINLSIITFIIIEQELRDQIEKAIDNFHKYTCVNFVPKTDKDTDYVVFKDGNGYVFYIHVLLKYAHIRLKYVHIRIKYAHIRPRYPHFRLKYVHIG